MDIRHYDHTQQDTLEALLVEYFTELDVGIPEETLRGPILTLMTEGIQKETLHISLAYQAGSPIGFSIYQIDSPASDWCKLPGWGCIREFYIRPGNRRKGFGTALANWTQSQLRQMGASHLYLTADDAVPFWTACAFSNSHEICSNELEILTK